MFPLSPFLPTDPPPLPQFSHLAPDLFCLHCTLASIHPELTEALFFLSTKAVPHSYSASCWIHSPVCPCQKEAASPLPCDSCLGALCTWSVLIKLWWIFWEQKDTVSPREQHRPSYYFSKDAADWPHVHWGHTYTYEYKHTKRISATKLHFSHATIF